MEFCPILPLTRPHPPSPLPPPAGLVLTKDKLRNNHDKSSSQIDLQKAYSLQYSIIRFLKLSMKVLFILIYTYISLHSSPGDFNFSQTFYSQSAFITNLSFAADNAISQTISIIFKLLLTISWILTFMPSIDFLS